MSLDASVAAVRVGVRSSLSDLRPGDRVIVACSGGADSLALLAATVFEATKVRVHVIGVTVDHGLQDDSSAHADRVRDQMAELGVDETVVVRVQVDAAGIGLEAAARQARYAALEQCVHSLEAALVLLGHTLDDQAETALLGLTRGAGGRSIAGMRPAFDHYRRPLLDVRRAQTEAACRAEGIEWWTDPHNADPRFLRSRVRHSVLPLLERELGPGVAETLARTASMLRPDMEALDALAATLFADSSRVTQRVVTSYPASRHELPAESSRVTREADPSDGADGADEADGADGATVVLDIDVLAAAPAAIRTRALHQAALAAGAIPAELAHVHIAALDALITDWHGQGPIDLPGHLQAVRRHRDLRFRRTST